MENNEPAEICDGKYLNTLTVTTWAISLIAVGSAYSLCKDNLVIVLAAISLIQSIAYSFPSIHQLCLAHKVLITSIFTNSLMVLYTMILLLSNTTPLVVSAVVHVLWSTFSLVFASGN